MECMINETPKFYEMQIKKCYIYDEKKQKKEKCCEKHFLSSSLVIPKISCKEDMSPC